MNINNIIQTVCSEINEDYYQPMFWTESELKRYVIQAVNQVIYDANILSTDNFVPLFSINTSVVEGLYAIPSASIQNINSLVWRGEDQDYPIEVVSIQELDKIDFNWRRNKVKGIPKYAVMINGNTTSDNLALDFTNNFPKIKLYPVPSVYNENVTIEIITQNIGTPTNDGFGGMAGSTDSLIPTVIDPIVSGIDTNDDGVSDLVIDESSPEKTFGIMVNLITNILLGDYYNIPIINYTPDITSQLYTYAGSIDVVSQLGIPNVLINAIVEYSVYKCYSKESESVDIQKAQLRLQSYKTILQNYTNQNFMNRQMRLAVNNSFI